MENGNGICFSKCRPRGAESSIDNLRKTKKVTKTIVIHQKNKAVATDNYQVGLHVTIIKAEGIDNPKLYSSVFNRHYNVVYWVVPGEELRTRLTDGIIPLWNHTGMISLDSLDDHVFLNVEVQRFNSHNVDPGTSCGRVVVGRARIPFPKKLNRERIGSFSLLRTQGENHKAEGEIVLAMKLEKIDIRPPGLLPLKADPLVLSKYLK